MIILIQLLITKPKKKNKWSNSIYLLILIKNWLNHTSRNYLDNIRLRFKKKN